MCGFICMAIDRLLGISSHLCSLAHQAGLSSPSYLNLLSRRAPNISNISKTFYIFLINCKHIFLAIYTLNIKIKSFLLLLLFLCFLGTKARQTTYGVALNSQEPVRFVTCSTLTPLCRPISLKPQLPLSCSLF